MIRLLRRTLPFALRRSYRRFVEQLQNPAAAQQALIETLVRDIAATEYGHAHVLKAGDGYDTFAARLPLVSYDGISEWVERQRQTEASIIAAGRVLFYETTSGSSGATKQIPYTRPLKDTFNRMFAVWLYDLLAHGPRFETGRLFISISPASQRDTKTEQGVAVGLDDDADYLNGWMRGLLRRFFVVPASVKHLKDADDFKHVLALFLLADERLEIVSIWNPSLLETLLDFITARRDTLKDDLRRGSVERGGCTFTFKRVTRERMALFDNQAIDWPRVWPRLKLISCWTSANAQTAAQRIAATFPGAFVQGKGLLATEAPMTLPLILAKGCVPLAGAVFYEFIDDAGKVLRLHEIEAGREYEIVITPRGGFARYRIGDRVRVTHFYQATPCLEFVGRNDAVCDLVGEKLNETFAQSRLSQLALASSRFQTLLPVMPSSGPSHYALVVDDLAGDAQALASRLDELLCEAHHYGLARRLGQLAPVQVCVAPDAGRIYYDYFISKGMKWGDIKHQSLIRHLEDAAQLLDRFKASALHCRALGG